MDDERTVERDAKQRRPAQGIDQRPTTQAGPPLLLFVGQTAADQTEVEDSCQAENADEERRAPTDHMPEG